MNRTRPFFDESAAATLRIFDEGGHCLGATAVTLDWQHAFLAHLRNVTIPIHRVGLATQFEVRGSTTWRGDVPRAQRVSVCPDDTITFEHLRLKVPR